MWTDIRVMISDDFVNESNLTGLDVCQVFINLGFELFDDEDRLKCNWLVLHSPCQNCVLF